MSSAEFEYRRPDIEGGVLTDPAEIDYYKQVQANDVIQNQLLGDFNNKGNYVVKKEIVGELLNLTKLMQHSYGKTLFCTSLEQVKTFGYLEFAIKIEKNQPTKGQAFATLELLEPINRVGGYYQNINTVLLATYTDTFNAEFIEKVYRAFNIVSDDFKGRKKINEEDIKEILERKNYLLALQKLMAVNLADTERKFFEERMDALGKSVFGKSILVKFQLEMNKLNKIFLNKNNPNYYTNLNQLLDKLIEENRKGIDKDLLEKLINIQKIYIKEYDTARVKSQEELTRILPPNVIIVQKENQDKNQKSDAKTQSVTLSAKTFASDKNIKVDVELEGKKSLQGQSKTTPIDIVPNENKEELLNVKLDDNSQIKESKSASDLSELNKEIEAKSAAEIVDLNKEIEQGIKPVQTNNFKILQQRANISGGASALEESTTEESSIK